MGQEIERKFLIDHHKLPALPVPAQLHQGYLASDPTVRVRLTVEPSGLERAYLTLKFRGGVARPEFEYAIPVEDARELLPRCATSLRKLRYRLGRFELDHFPDRALWLAEIELSSESEDFDRPEWLGLEVTHDGAYANVNLAKSH